MPLLPLYTFFETLGFHPWHAFGIAGTGDLAISTGCDTLVRRYEWQNSDAVGHKAIEEAIETAEHRLRQYLGFSVAPRYTSETVAWPARADGLFRSGPWDADGRWLNVQLGEGEIRAIGTEAHTAIDAAAAVTYTDTDSDGIEDTFTVSASTSVTDTSEIAVYFASADRFSGWGATTALSARWRLRPVQVTIVGGTVTVRGPKQLCVKPIKYEGATNIGADGLDPDTAANFVTTLDIERRYTDATGTTAATAQAAIVWETRPSHGWWCCCGCQDSDPFSGSPYDPAATASAAARAGIRDARAGIVHVAEAAYDSTTGVWSSLDWTVCDVPDRAVIRYLAGYPLDSDGQMAEPYRTIVARMAAAELAGPVCGCEAANRELARWQFDLARATGANDESYQVTQEDLLNPFGTRRGQVDAWRKLRRVSLLRGILN